MLSPGGSSFGGRGHFSLEVDVGGMRVIPVVARRALVTVLVAGCALVGAVVTVSSGPRPAPASFASSYQYATMSDGTQIALAVSFPSGYAAGQRLPTLFEMDGYEGGGLALDPSEWNDRYVVVHASVRGTGCSTGQFDLFSWADADDGAQVVEHWIPSQPWSDGAVGIIGHSYPGLTGFMTAERIGYDLARPGYSPYGGTNHLKAVAVSGLVDDLYSGITYLGGIPDLGFPLAWAGVLRPESEISGNVGRIQSSTMAGDPACLDGYSQHEVSTTPLNPDLTPVADNPIVNGAVDSTDGPWWAAHSLDTYLSWLAYTDAPVHIDQQYQDEQTGPRGGERLLQDIERMDQSATGSPLPYRIVFVNGRHDSAGPVYHPDEQHWLDCYEAAVQQACTDLGQPNGNWRDWTNAGTAQTYASSTTSDPCPGVSVLLYFEKTGDFETTGNPSSSGINPPLCAPSFPLPGTTWTRYYLHADGTLGTASEPGGARSYLSTTIGPDDYPGPSETGIDPADVALYDGAVGPVTSSPGPQELTYETPAFTQATTLDGPIEADLHAVSTAPDTDYFVQLVDVGPSGQEQFLQYGLLRASFRSVDPSGSQCVAGTGTPEPCATPGSTMIWPDHPFTQTALLTPLQAYTANVEVYPLGWVFRPGHRLMVSISAPPLLDQLYAWAASARPVGVDTILSSSSIVLPLQSVGPVLAAGPPACGSQEGVRCTPPAETATPSGLPAPATAP